MGTNKKIQDIDPTLENEDKTFAVLQTVPETYEDMITRVMSELISEEIDREVLNSLLAGMSAIVRESTDGKN